MFNAAFLQRCQQAFFLWLALALPAIAIAVQPDALARFGWRLDELSARPWMFLTAHFTHLNLRHLLGNLTAAFALCLIALQFAELGREATPARPLSLRLPLLVAFCALDAGLCTGWWNTHWYAGLSGLLYALFAALATWLATQPRARPWGIVLLLATAAKIAIDLHHGTGALTDTGIPLAPAAHLYGATAASLTMLAQMYWQAHRPARPQPDAYSAPRERP